MAVFISPGGIFHGNLTKRRALRTSRESFLIMSYRKVALSGGKVFAAPGSDYRRLGFCYAFQKIQLFLQILADKDRSVHSLFHACPFNMQHC